MFGLFAHLPNLRWLFRLFVAVFFELINGTIFVYLVVLIIAHDIIQCCWLSVFFSLTSI